MDLERLYEFRFRGIDQEKREEVWKPLSRFITGLANNATVVLDPACGLGEFINSCPSPEKWALDLGIDGTRLHDEITFQKCSIQNAQLPLAHFELIFLSNILEHLSDQESVNQYLVHCKKFLKPNGRIVVMGPNFKFCASDYFDCADHVVPLTHVSIEEHLAAAGYEILSVIPRFLPFSFRSRLPANPLFTSVYLHVPLLWKFLGKQFLIVASPK